MKLTKTLLLPLLLVTALGVCTAQDLTLRYKPLFSKVAPTRCSPAKSLRGRSQLMKPTSLRRNHHSAWIARRPKTA